MVDVGGSKEAANANHRCGAHDDPVGAVLAYALRPPSFVGVVGDRA